MSPKAKKALERSIRKWEGIVAGDTEDKGETNCALCRLYNKDDGCNGCPVKVRTGRNWCFGSPYDRWIKLTSEEEDGYAHDHLQRRAALKMLRFLEDLRG